MEMLHLCSCHDQIPRVKPTKVCPSASLLTFPFCEYVNFLEKCKINYCISVPARKFWNLKGLIFSWIALKGSVIDKYSKFPACHIITRSGLINWRRESQSACVISFISRGEGILFTVEVSVTITISIQRMIVIVKSTIINNTTLRLTWFDLYVKFPKAAL